MIADDIRKSLPFNTRQRMRCSFSLPIPTVSRIVAEGERLSPDYLYFVDGKNAGVLSTCTADTGALVLCAGNIKDESLELDIDLVEADCDLISLINASSACMMEWQHITRYEESRISQKFASIIDSRVPDEAVDETICDFLPKKLKPSYCVICIEFNVNGSATGSRSAKVDLEAVFPEDNIIQYDSRYVIIRSFDNDDRNPEIPMEELERVLEKYDAFAGVSNTVSSYSKLRILYELANIAAESKKVVSGSEKRVIFYDDIMIYSLVSLASLSLSLKYANDDLILLGSPKLFDIVKEDQNGDKRFVDTLVAYIEQGGSVEAAGKRLYMHKNTVRNKLQKMEDIIGESIVSNGALQAKLLISYYIMQYYTKGKNKNIIFSSREIKK